ncbi:hypothetical protein OIU76_027848 [Salix suchowensis]|nr:hypothetical protein OIU76_027848 [Salix suchowensis]
MKTQSPPPPWHSSSADSSRSFLATLMKIPKRVFKEPLAATRWGSVWDGFGSYDLSSLRDRTKDILSVVVALLFGVGCGALTAATMYLVWSLFSPSQSRYDDYFDGEFSDEEEEDLKKIGYVKIPEAEQVKGGSVYVPVVAERL